MGREISRESWPLQKMPSSGMFLLQLKEKELICFLFLQVSYAIGVAKPVSISIFHYGTSKYTSQQLLKIVNANFDLRPGRIVKDLELRKPIYKDTSCYGHFGREGFAWEKPKQLVIPKNL